MTSLVVAGGGGGGEGFRGEVEGRGRGGEGRGGYTCIRTYVRTCVRTYVRAYMHACMHACMHKHIHSYMRTYVRTYILISESSYDWSPSVTPSLPTKSIPAKVRGFKTCGKLPMDARIPPLKIEILLESSPLKSGILVLGRPKGSGVSDPCFEQMYFHKYNYTCTYSHIKN